MGKRRVTVEVEVADDRHCDCGCPYMRDFPDGQACVLLGGSSEQEERLIYIRDGYRAEPLVLDWSNCERTKTCIGGEVSDG